MPKQKKSKFVPIVEEAPPPSPAIRGRGASWSPANRFEKLHIDLGDEDVVQIDPTSDEETKPRRETQYFRDQTKTIIARNDSPDVGFETSVNPYRGCEHGCIYCFARPTHEYLGMSAGLDFESRIVVKHDAPRLLEAELSSPKWKPQILMMSGVTDCYQPIERKLRLTRQCLEVLAKFRNPVGILTKNRLVARDIDVLSELNEHNCAAVNLSVTSLEVDLQRILEPRTSAPQARLEAVAQLHEAKIPVGVMVAPVIPGINDHEIPKIVAACAEAGAQFAGYVLLRLPWAVAPLFEHWLEEHFPERKAKVLNLVKATRGGDKLYDSRWRMRQIGEGVYAKQIETMFDVACRRAKFGNRPELSTAAFRRPNEQLKLFG